MDGRTDKGIPVYPPLCEWGYNYNITTLCIPNIENKSWVTEQIGDSRMLHVDQSFTFLCHALLTIVCLFIHLSPGIFLYYLSFDLQLLITTLVSSNISS
jgi:hypothetical protein